MSTIESDQARWFSEKVQPHELMLRAWLRIRFPTVRRSDTDDIVQEAYMRLLAARQSHGELEHPKAFLFTTARNLALDLLRHDKIARESPLVESGALRVLDESDPIPEAMARKQELAFLMEAIQSLPGRCRQIFTWRKVYGWSQKDIASRMGISERTVSAQLTIAIHKCARYVDLRRRERRSVW
jgi:RNA polymerase sigma factor (sigma-70 family)